MKRQIRKGWRAPGEVSLKAEALVGEPADVIYDYVENNAIRLVVMSTCGGSGLKTWLLGSVAEKVVRSVSAPILLVRVKRGQPVSVGRRSISRILLPLDGSEVSKTSVPYALEIARKLKASITLYGMVDEAQVMSPLLYSESMVEKYTEMKAATEKEFRSYIGGVEKELRQEGVHVTHVVTRGYDAAHEILNQEKATKAELVVMATRGRSPVARWAFGSVAEKVLREGDLPLLLVREAAR